VDSGLPHPKELKKKLDLIGKFRDRALKRAKFTSTIIRIQYSPIIQYRELNEASKNYIYSAFSAAKFLLWWTSPYVMLVTIRLRLSTLWARIFPLLRTTFQTGMGQSEAKNSCLLNGPLIQKLKEPALSHVANWRLSDFWQEVNWSGQGYRPVSFNLMGLVIW
jgi:hypothetical protein